MHWDVPQCTIHPFVVCWRENDSEHHQRLCFVSDETKHSARYTDFLRRLIPEVQELIPDLCKNHYWLCRPIQKQVQFHQHRTPLRGLRGSHANDTFCHSIRQECVRWHWWDSQKSDGEREFQAPVCWPNYVSAGNVQLFDGKIRNHHPVSFGGKRGGEENISKAERPFLSRQNYCGNSAVSPIRSDR